MTTHAAHAATALERPAEQQQASRLPAWEQPSANIREERDAYVLELEMPGVSKTGIEVTVEQNELTIVGHRSDVQPQGEAVYQESHRADYRRSFELDPSINSGKIHAKMEQGILTLTLPKAESIKPRKIQVAD
ncbi:MAG: Hsp20/alpha crystallin family protein [Chthoniobacteraceae bacterium]|nr:Hsp20/alpha crystallin family protein [Chthoniobacteraceae bacterium]